MTVTVGLVSCADPFPFPGEGDLPGPAVGGTVAGYEAASEAVVRAFPRTVLDRARTELRVAYRHTSHGTHVSRGAFGLPSYKAGDDALFGVSTSGSPGKLWFADMAINPAGATVYDDLSQGDSDWSQWLNQNRAWLDSDDTEGFNVVLWSWCNIAGHDVAAYLAAMETLIAEYGPGGTKVGAGIGKTRVTPVRFVFMTGHANGAGANLAEGQPAAQARRIVEHCRARGRYCIDYWSIDSHDMDGRYWDDADDDGYSPKYQSATGSATGNFLGDWQAAHTEGTDWFFSLSSPGGTPTPGDHNSQYLTADRKAWALWWVLARIVSE